MYKYKIFEDNIHKTKSILTSTGSFYHLVKERSNMFSFTQIRVQMLHYNIILLVEVKSTES